MPSTIHRRIWRILASLGLIAATLAIVAGLARSQTTTDNRPRFEVASIKPCKADMLPEGRSGGGPTETSSERLTLNCTTVHDLVRMAYVAFANGRYDQLSSVPIEGGPAWINSDPYQIEAKTASAQSQIKMRGVMLQALLEDRLRLKIRRETRDIPIYALTVAKGGTRMPQFKEGTCIPLDLVQFISQFPYTGRWVPELPAGQKYCLNSNPMKGPNVVWNADGMSVEELCRFVLRGMDRPVVDKTGLTGRFDVRLEYFPDENSSSTVRRGGSLDDGDHPEIPAGPSIFTALQEQLGLRLERAQGPGEFLVIDRVEKPSDN